MTPRRQFPPPRSWGGLGRGTNRRHFLTVIAGAALSACGFQPVYMPTASGKTGVAQRELASIYVEIIPDRPGQVLRQALQERFGDDSGTPSAYDLSVSFSISGQGLSS